MEEQTIPQSEIPPQSLKPMFFGDRAPQPLLRRLLWFAGSVIVSWVLMYIVSQSWMLATGVTLIFLLHEFGHLVAMRIYGYTGLNMVFIPLLGAYVSGKRNRSIQSQEVIVSLAGPVPGLLLASVLLLLPGPLPAYMQTFIFIAIFINALNLLPFQPLDGGRIINMLMGRQDGMYTVIMHATVVILAAMLVWQTGSFLWILLGFYAFRMAMAEWKVLPVRRTMLADGVDFQQNYDSLNDQEYIRLRRYLPAYDASFGYIGQTTWAEVPELQRRSEEIAMRSLLQEPVDYNLNIGKQLLVCAVWIGAFLLPFLIIGPQKAIEGVSKLLGLQL
jgi:stage IV sporulation protein FB